MSSESPASPEQPTGNPRLEPESQAYLLENYGTTDPWKIAAQRRAKVRGERQSRIDSLAQTGWVEIEGDARVPDDDPGLTAEDLERQRLAEQAMDEFDALDEKHDVVATSGEHFKVEIPEDLLIVHFVVKVPEGIALDDQRRLLLRKFQEAAQYCGFTPVLATAKEAKASDLANSGGELGSAARTVGVRGQERPDSGS